MMLMPTIHGIQACSSLSAVLACTDLILQIHFKVAFITFHFKDAITDPQGSQATYPRPLSEEEEERRWEPGEPGPRVPTALPALAALITSARAPVS